MQMTIDLAPSSRSDLPQLMAWRNDWRIMDWTRQSDLLNEAEHADWFEKQARDPQIRMYKHSLKAAGTTNDVGVCGLTSIDYRNSRGEFSLYVAPSFQRRGIGKIALMVLLAHGFTNLGLHLIYGETFDGNPATKTFEALGMTKEGTRRSFYWKGGRRLDAHLYSITRDEWHARNDHHRAPCDEPSDNDQPLAPVKALGKRKSKSSTVGRAHQSNHPPDPEPPGAA